MNALTGQDIRKLANILNGTLSLTDLQSFVYASTGDQLFDAFVAPNQPKIPLIEQLLAELEKIGATANFLGYVYINRPGRADVREAISKYSPEAVATRDKKIDLSAQTAGIPQEKAPENAVAPGFERNVRPFLPQLDVRVWQQRLLQIERQVCRVELDGEALGTGFLIGPKTVLTNWHVYEAAKHTGRVEKLGCRFDYTRLPTGEVEPGKLVIVDSSVAVDGSPYSNAEISGNPEGSPPS